MDWRRAIEWEWAVLRILTGAANDCGETAWLEASLPNQASGCPPSATAALTRLVVTQSVA